MASWRLCVRHPTNRMKEANAMKWVPETKEVATHSLAKLAAWGLAALFIYAGVTKSLAPWRFADSVASFRLLPPIGVNVVAGTLPVMEALMGLLLIAGFGPMRRAGAIGLVGLNVAFILALGSAIARGIIVDCGCFGSGEPSMAKTWWALIRDVGLLVAAVWLYLRWSRESIEPAFARVSRVEETPNHP